MSGSRVPHLLCRNGIYHFRMKVPAYVQSTLGSREVHRSFGSCSLARARALAAIYAVRMKGVFAVMHNCDLTQSEARSLVQTCFHDLVREAESWELPAYRHRDAEVAEQREAASLRIASLLEQIGSGNFDRTVKIVAASYVASGVNVSADRQLDLHVGVARALVEQQSLLLLRLDDRLLKFEPSDPLFAATPLPDAVEDCPLRSSEAVGPTVGEAAALYLEAGRRRWVPKTYAARDWQIRFLQESLGKEKRLALVTAHDVRRFRDQVLSLRANHGRRRHISFAERQTENIDRRIAPKTAAIIFDAAKAFFAWAKSEEGMIAINPAADVRIVFPKKPKGQRSRRPFTADELRRLFSSTIFTGSKSRHRRFEPGDQIYRDAKFWVPVLGYYTGARMGELVQLHTTDVVLGPIPHISINEDYLLPSERKHVKTAAGVRLVPLHPDLLLLGFDDFVRKASRSGKPKRLFPEVEFGCDGQASSRFSKWFARCMDHAGLTDPALVFHSFRHNAEDAFRDAERPQYVIDRIIGHSDGATSAGYGNGISLDVAAAAVASMRLPVRLPALWQRSDAETSVKSTANRTLIVAAGRGSISVKVGTPAQPQTKVA